MIDKTPKPILIFDPCKHFVGVARSETALTHLLGVSPSQVHTVASGEKISVKGYYLRHLLKGFDIMANTNITLKEYDGLCGVKRKYYINANMSRKGMKYKKHPKETAKEKAAHILAMVEAELQKQSNSQN